MQIGDTTVDGNLAHSLRADALREAAAICDRAASRFLTAADEAQGRDRKDIRAKAAGAYLLRRQILALIEGQA